MAWFHYGDQEKRAYRRGIWLRVRHIPEDIIEKAKPFMYKGEIISHVIVKELLPDNRVLLEFWCRRETVGWWKKQRFIVFYVEVEEDPKWACESDCGRGLVRPRKPA